MTAAYDTDAETRRTAPAAKPAKVVRDKPLQMYFSDEEKTFLLTEAARRKEKVGPTARRLMLERYGWQGGGDEEE